MILALFAAALSALPIEGTVREECAAAVPIPSALYAHASQDRPHALWDELRIRDSAGRAVPYVLRERQVRKERVEKVWKPLTVTGVVETNGELVVEAELPESKDPRPEKLLALKVATPLKDYEQTVTVSVDGAVVARGTLADYSRYANLSRSEVALDIPASRRFTVTFASPESEAEGAVFERTITADGAGGVTAKTVRGSVVRRPFRIDSLAVAFPETRVDFEPLADGECNVRANLTRDVKEKKTYLDLSSFGMPVTAVGLCVKDRNFSRAVAVLERRNGGWARINSGRVTAVNLPGQVRNDLRLAVGALRETVFRLEIDDGDDPPLDFEFLPVKLFVRPYEAVFVAKPGESYKVELEAGGKRPQYDSTLLDYVRQVRDPQPLELAAFDADFGADAPTAVWMSGVDWIGLASLVAFVLLGFVCWKLMKGGAR